MLGRFGSCRKNPITCFAGHAGSQQLMACGASNHFWHFSVFDSRTFCSNILLDDLAMRTAFCSNTRVHTRFVELTASPCRWTHIFFFNGETLNRKRGTNFISELVSWNSSCVFKSFFLLDNHDDCRKKCVNRAFVAPFWLWHAIVNYGPNVSHSATFVHFLSQSEISPKFTESQSTDSMRDEHFAVGNARVKQGYGACKSAALSAFLKADNRHFFFLLPHPHARRHSPISLWCFFWKLC